MKNGSEVGGRPGEDGSTSHVEVASWGGWFQRMVVSQGVTVPGCCRGPVWGGVGVPLGLKRASVTLTRVKACLDSVLRRREMETVNTAS